MRRFIFADEAGNFHFSRNRGATRYFIICSIALEDCQLGNDLLELRRQLAWDGAPLGDYFHATTDKQVIRDHVFDLISRETFRVDATILEKSKAMPQVRISQERFYQYGWYYHFKNVAPAVCNSYPELMVTAASIGTKKGQAAFTAAVNDCVQQTLKSTSWSTYFAPCQTDPCLQLADYCTWAIQRKWEQGDDRSYVLIQDKIVREYDLWQRGTRHYY